MAERNNNYFEARLLREHPAVHAAFKAGAFPSLRAACISVGLISPRSRLSELMNAFAKATSTERTEFLDHLSRIGACVAPASVQPMMSSPSKAGVAGVSPSSSLAKAKRPKTRSPFTIAVNGHLTPQAKASVLKIMDKKGFIGSRGQRKTGKVIHELGAGFSSLDPSLGMALRRGTALKDDFLEALEGWILTNS